MVSVIEYFQKKACKSNVRTKLVNRWEFHLSFTNNKIGLDIEFQNLDHMWMEK